MDDPAASSSVHSVASGSPIGVDVPDVRSRALCSVRIDWPSYGRAVHLSHHDTTSALFMFYCMVRCEPRVSPGESPQSTSMSSSCSCSSNHYLKEPWGQKHLNRCTCFPGVSDDGLDDTENVTHSKSQQQQQHFIPFDVFEDVLRFLDDGPQSIFDFHSVVGPGHARTIALSQTQSQRVMLPTTQELYECVVVHRFAADREGDLNTILSYSSHPNLRSPRFHFRHCNDDVTEKHNLPTGSSDFALHFLYFPLTSDIVSGESRMTNILEWRDAVRKSSSAPISVVLVRTVFRQIADAIHYLHVWGYVLERLEPDFVCIVFDAADPTVVHSVKIRNEEAVVIGSRRALRPNTPTTTTASTRVTYTSPDFLAQQLCFYAHEHQQHHHPVHDWYSYGALLFEFLGGVPPHVGSLKVQRHARRQIQNLSRDLDDLIVRLTALSSCHKDQNDQRLPDALSSSNSALYDDVCHGSADEDEHNIDNNEFVEQDDDVDASSPLFVSCAATDQLMSNSSDGPYYPIARVSTNASQQHQHQQQHRHSHGSSSTQRNPQACRSILSYNDLLKHPFFRT